MGTERQVEVSPWPPVLCTHNAQQQFCVCLWNGATLSWPSRIRVLGTGLEFCCLYAFRQTTVPEPWSVGRAIAKVLQWSVVVITCSWVVARGSFIRLLVCEVFAEMASVVMLLSFCKCFFQLFFISLLFLSNDE